MFSTFVRVVTHGWEAIFMHYLKYKSDVVNIKNINVVNGCKENQKVQKKSLVMLFVIGNR